jgi:hypothetical protein
MERLFVYCDKHVFLIYLKKKSPIRGMGYEYFADRQNHCLVSVRLTDASKWGRGFLACLSGRRLRIIGGAIHHIGNVHKYAVPKITTLSKPPRARRQLSPNQRGRGEKLSHYERRDRCVQDERIRWIWRNFLGMTN